MNRWTILAVLFAARTAMAFQFQSLAALSAPVMEARGIGMGDIGLLIGLYLAPGIVVAIPGSAMSSRLGDKRVVTAGLVLMVSGAALAFGASDNWLTASRVVAGTGGVLLNIVMTKMLVDWFQGREIATAMSIFINSWPVGIGLASASLPLVAQAGGLTAGWWATLAVVAAGLFLFQFYRPPAETSEVTLKRQSLPWMRLTSAGMVWAFYNAALAVIFSFGALLLAGRGLGEAAAGGIISAFMLIFGLSAPVGGYLADRTGRAHAIIATGCMALAVVLPVIALAPWPVAIALLFLLAPISAVPAGSIMTLPGSILQPQARAFGMGVFFTIYYAVMMIAPRIAGGLAERSGQTASAFHTGAAFSLVALLFLALFRRGVRSDDAG